MDADNLVVRVATEDDAQDVAIVWHESWHSTHAVDTDPDVVAWRGFDWFLRRSTLAMKSAYVAERDQRLVAFVAWDNDKLGQLFVEQAEYGRGTADRLLASSEAAMTRSGVKQAYLYCRMTNARALQFYQKHGWSKDTEIVEQLMCAAGTRPSRVWRMIKSLQ